MALDPLSIVTQIWEFGIGIMAALEKAGHNADDCHRIGELLHRLDAIAKHLQATPEAMGHGSMRDAAAGLDDALRRASELVAKCDRKGFLRHAWEAKDIADKLRKLCLDVLLNLSVVLLANGVHTTSMVAEVKEAIAELRANAAYTNSMLAKLLEIVAERPDGHMQKEVAQLLQDYQKSTEYATSQDGNKRETKKSDVGRLEVKIQKNNGLRASKAAPHASLSDGLAESASVESVTRKCGSSTIISKASSSVSKLADEQPVAVSAAPFQLQQIIGVSEVPGEIGRYKIHSQSSTGKLLEIYPLKLRFPFKPNKKPIQCPVTLTNNTDRCVGIWIKPTNERFTRATTTIIEPHFTLVVSLTMNMHEQLPQDTVKFEVLMVVVQSKHDLVKLESSIGGKLNMDIGFMSCVEKLQAEVYQGMLTAMISDPASCQIISRPIKNMTSMTSIDAHPTKTWIVTGHEGGNFSIRDYQKQKTMMELQVNKVPGKAAHLRHRISQYFKETTAPHRICSVKFIAHGNLLAVGDGRGYIYIYAYTGTELCELKKFRAHHSSVNLLTIHPTKQYLLSSSIFGNKIKHWDCSSNWLKIQEFDVGPTYEDGVRSVKFNPRDTNAFASVTYDKRVKVGNIKSSDLTTKPWGPSFKAADYFFTHSHQHLMVTLRCKSPNAEVRDLVTGEVVHTFGVSGHKTKHVAFLPTLLKLVTTLDDGTVCLWDASTYRLEEMVHITDGKPRDLVFVTDTNGLTRFVVRFETSIAINNNNNNIAFCPKQVETSIAIMEVKSPTANRSKQTVSGNYG